MIDLDFGRGIDHIKNGGGAGHLKRQRLRRIASRLLSRRGLTCFEQMARIIVSVLVSVLHCIVVYVALYTVETGRLLLIETSRYASLCLLSCLSYQKAEVTTEVCEWEKQIYHEYCKYLYRYKSLSTGSGSISSILTGRVARVNRSNVETGRLWQSSYTCWMYSLLSIVGTPGVSLSVPRHNSVCGLFI